CLKKKAGIADISGKMTVSTITTLDEWAAHPYGKAARIALAVLGLASAVLVLMVATMHSQAAWLLVLLGVALAGTTVRAASKPSVIRLTTLAAVMVSVLYVGQTF
ncbi:MAG: hypothetical protein ACRDXF_06355, partial [Acidimicrobiia bacterium]